MNCRWILLVLILFLSACKSNVASESISQSVINDLNVHQQAIVNLEKQTSKECKTDAFMTSLNSLKTQTNSIAGQVKSITQACNSEKMVLVEKITIREIVIGILCAVIGIMLFLWLRFKR